MLKSVDAHRALKDLLFKARDHRPAPLARLLALARYPYALLRDLGRGELNLRATDLTYTTLLSLVPLMAFGFAVLKGLGLHRDLEPLIYQFFEPLGGEATQLTARIMDFVERTQGGVLGSLGLALLLYTVVSTIQKVEQAFNFAWHVEQPRSLVRRVSEYLSLAFIGPIFLVVVFGLISAVRDYTLMQWLAAHEPFGSVFAFLGRIGPYAFVALVFTFLYAYVPNARVRAVPACIGGCFAGVLWAGSGIAFAGFVGMSTGMVAVYAGFAIFLAALIWIYLSWLILLLGAQLSFYVQNPRCLLTGSAELKLSNGLRERIGLAVMYLVGRDHHLGTHRWTLRALAEHFDIPSSTLADVTRPLERAGLLLSTEDDLLLPGRDLASLGLDVVMRALREDETQEARLIRRSRGLAPTDALVDEMDAAAGRVLGGRTLGSLLAERRPD
jgi:membrane protein